MLPEPALTGRARPCAIDAWRRASALAFLAAIAVSGGCQGEEEGEDAIQSGLDAPRGPGAPAARCLPAKRFVGEAWPEADALFHRDPRWLGGDAAYSIALSADRILWLFGDSFIATSERHVRTQSKMVRNSIAIQTGTDPTKSSIAFEWRQPIGPKTEPASFFPEDGAHWFWPMHGARVGSELVLFLNELEKTDGGLGFESVGTRMLRITNPDEPPSRWTWTSRRLPSDGRTHGTAVVVADDFLYGLSTRSSPLFFDVELERWPVTDLDRDGALWTGSRFGGRKASVPVWGGGAPEFATLSLIHI